MYEDKTLVCKDCGKEFVFTAGEQEFYAEKGFTNEPQRCKECRDKRKHAPREYHDAVCASCGKACKVPWVQILLPPPGQHTPDTLGRFSCPQRRWAPLVARPIREATSQRERHRVRTAASSCAFGRWKRLCRCRCSSACNRSFHSRCKHGISVDRA